MRSSNYRAEAPKDALANWRNSWELHGHPAFRLEFHQPQGHVAVALARPAHSPQAIDQRALRPDLLLACEFRRMWMGRPIRLHATTGSVLTRTGFAPCLGFGDRSSGDGARFEPEDAEDVKEEMGTGLPGQVGRRRVSAGSQDMIFAGRQVPEWARRAARRAE